MMVCRYSGRLVEGGGGLHLSAVIFKEVTGGGAANCIDGAW